MVDFIRGCKLYLEKFIGIKDLVLLITDYIDESTYSLFRLFMRYWIHRFNLAPNAEYIEWRDDSLTCSNIWINDVQLTNDLGDFAYMKSEGQLTRCCINKPIYFIRFQADHNNEYITHSTFTVRLCDNHCKFMRNLIQYRITDL